LRKKLFTWFFFSLPKVKGIKTSAQISVIAAVLAGSLSQPNLTLEVSSDNMSTN